MDKLESISCLIDGEADNTHDLVDELVTSTDEQKVWARYHLIGDTLRGAMPEHIEKPHGDDLCHRISQAIASEPTVLAPRRRSAPAFARPALGFAVAASCAAVVLFSANLFNPTPSSTDQTKLVIEGPLSSTGSVETVAATAPAPVLPSPAAALVTEARQQAEATTARTVVLPSGNTYNPYIVRHSEQRVSAGMPGVNPYARLIGHRPENAR